MGLKIFFGELSFAENENEFIGLKKLLIQNALNKRMGDGQRAFTSARSCALQYPLEI
jgi:hypothetical protein